MSDNLGDAHRASAPTVRRLLDEMDYSPHVNRKELAASSPDRDEQFRYLQTQKQAFIRRGWPVIYVDTKKRELIGLFKNSGTQWRRAAQRVNIYDFRSLAEGIAIPYGIYDPVQNTGYVSVGTCADTAQFAVATIYWWWQLAGQTIYPRVPQLLILADGGGSNGYRPRLWKFALQHDLVQPTGLSVTVCHYPTGASKWSWVEHRLFSLISANWKGEPLNNYAKMLRLINATTSTKGLVVQASLNEIQYATKIKISDEQMAALNLTHHTTLPDWNYTIKPITR